MLCNLDYTFTSCKKFENAFAQFPRKTLDKRKTNKRTNRKKYFVGPLRVKSTGHIFDESFSQHMQ